MSGHPGPAPSGAQDAGPPLVALLQELQATTARIVYEEFWKEEDALMTWNETMDGSPAVVTKTLGDLHAAGKFRGQAISEYAQEAVGNVIELRFQAGPIGEVGVNGCSIEDVIDVLVERLEGFQRGRFRCEENAMAIFNLNAARGELFRRTGKRQAQGVEGRNLPHVS